MGKGHFRIAYKRLTIVVDFLPHKGYCVRWIGPPFTSDWPALTAGRHYERPSMKKRVAKTGPDAAKSLASTATTLLEKHRSLLEHCSCRAYDDGDAREPGWFTVKTQGAAWVVQVKDPDSCTSFTAVAETADKALDLAALLLECDEAPWEHDTWLLKAKGRGKK